jgi:two-component system response regulator HydG
MAANDAGNVLKDGPTVPSNDIAPIADIERQAILGTIHHLNGDKLMAAKLLGIGKTTLYRKLKEYSLAGAGDTTGD